MKGYTTNNEIKTPMKENSTIHNMLWNSNKTIEPKCDINICKIDEYAYFLTIANLIDLRFTAAHNTIMHRQQSDEKCPVNDDVYWVFMQWFSWNSITMTYTLLQKNKITAW